MCGQYHQRLSNMQQNWEKYIERLIREYSHFLLIVSPFLLLSVVDCSRAYFSPRCYSRTFRVNAVRMSLIYFRATVGVLTLPEIPRSAMTASMISALSSLGSIIVGVFFIWRHQANPTAIDSVCRSQNVLQGV